MIKITKIREYRICFERDGRHYSIQDFGECFEPMVGMICKEDETFFKKLSDESFSIADFDKEWKLGMVYKRFSIKELEKLF